MCCPVARLWFCSQEMPCGWSVESGLKAQPGQEPVDLWHVTNSITGNSVNPDVWESCCRARLRFCKVVPDTRLCLMRCRTIHEVNCIWPLDFEEDMRPLVVRQRHTRPTRLQKSAKIAFSQHAEASSAARIVLKLL